MVAQMVTSCLSERNVCWKKEVPVPRERMWVGLIGHFSGVQCHITVWVQVPAALLPPVYVTVGHNLTSLHPNLFFVKLT